MLDVLFVLLFAGLPIATFLITRSLTWTAVGLVFGFGVAGNLVQSTTSLGMAWNTRGLQWLSVGVLALVLVLGAVWGRRRTGLRRQLLAVVLPMILIGGFLIAMRMLASGAPGPLSAVGYLINHPLAEDNAKWLHLTAQLADGRDITFHGYAGGPLLLLMSMMAALISALSMLLLGGVNEVAVAANTVVGVQFLLIVLVPAALAPLAERRVRLRTAEVLAPTATIWAGIGVLFLASAVITSYGHLSLQFVLIVLVLWSLVFLVSWPGQGRLLMTMAIATTASVWLPFNVLGLALLVGTLIWVARQRNWLGLGAWVLTLLAVWDALISSTLYLLGLGHLLEGTGVGAGAADDAGMSGEAGLAVLSDQVTAATSLFTAPGGVEQIQPVTAILAIGALLFVVWLMASNRVSTSWSSAVPFVPVIALGAYLFLIEVGDAVTTGAAPHYGGHKLAFALTIMVLASMLPVALTGLGDHEGRMSLLRWMAIGAVAMLFMLDTMLPRAISALSPKLWPAVNASAPQYWSAAEVKDTANQPISSLPIACLWAPPAVDVPTALPTGQESYACTRLLIGLAGLEGQVGVLPAWLQTDWMANRQTWAERFPQLEKTTAKVRDRSAILLGPDGQVAGLATWGLLLDRHRPVP